MAYWVGEYIKTYIQILISSNGNFTFLLIKIMTIIEDATMYFKYTIFILSFIGVLSISS